MGHRDLKVIFLMGKYQAYLEMVGYTMKRVDITMAMVKVNREADKIRDRLIKMGCIMGPFKKDEK